MNSELTEEMAASQRHINSIYTDGMDAHSLKLIDRRVKGIPLSDEDTNYLANQMTEDSRLCDHYQLELMAMEAVCAPKRSPTCS